MTTHPRAQAGQYLTFRVADEEYGAPILQVREILRYTGVTRVPTAPPAVRGVLNLRGSVLPVIDLGLKLGLAPTVATPRTCVVVAEAEVNGEREAVGLLTDAVERVAEFAADDIEPPPTFGTRVRAQGLLGLGRSGGRFIPILDLARLLSEDELRGAAADEAPASTSADNRVDAAEASAAPEMPAGEGESPPVSPPATEADEAGEVGEAEPTVAAGSPPPLPAAAENGGGDIHAGAAEGEGAAGGGGSTRGRRSTPRT